MFKINWFRSKLLLSFILLLGCNYNDFEDDIDTLKVEIENIQTVNDLLSLKNILLEAKLIEEPIININTQDNIITELELEIRGLIQIENNLIVGFNTNEDEWLVDFVYSDSTSFQTWYLGNDMAINIEINLDFFNSSPLTAMAKIQTPIEGKFELRIVGQDGEFSDIITSFSDIRYQHVIEVLGLYPDFENTVDFSFLSPLGTKRKTVTYNITTDPLPKGLPDFEVTTQYNTTEQNVVFLVNFQPTGIPFMVDRFGKIRWYSTGFSEGLKFALQRFKNGNMGFGKGGNGQGSVFEYSITGELIKEYSFYPEFENAHHDVYEMGNGNFLIPVNKVGEPTIEDYIIELDRNSGIITNIWDLNQILPKRDTLINNATDWVHVNAVIHDELDNSIIISGQRQGLFKVTWENRLKWIFAPPFDWDGFEEYLLTSLDPNMEWVWGQHAPLITPEGNLFLFDNGFGRGFGTSEKFSRALEVYIDEDSIGGTVKTLWEFGKERGEEFYSPVVSDVDYIESSRTKLIVAGSLALDVNYIDNDNYPFSWSADLLKSSVLEIDENRNVLFELHIKSEILRSAVYRAEKLSLY